MTGLRVVIAGCFVSFALGTAPTQAAEALKLAVGQFRRRR
jgi:hypothetical protein